MKQFFFLVIVMASLTACSSSKSTLFTQRFYRESGLTADDLKKVQFYVDKDIVLHRVMRDGESAVKEGRIVFNGGKRVQEIVIRRDTKGVLVFMPKDDRFGICFNPNDDSKYLMFGPNPKNNNKYNLLADEWRQKSGTVTYGGEKWSTPSASAFATLYIQYSGQETNKYHSKVEKGRSVNGH